MKTKLVAVTCLVISAALTPALMTRAYADDANDSSTGASSSPRVYVKDSAITAKIKAKLAEQKPSSLVRISVETDDDGTVWLDGDALTKSEADKAVQIAQATKGVTSVRSHINVKAPS